MSAPAWGLAASAKTWPRLRLPIAVSESGRRPFVAAYLQLLAQAAGVEWDIQVLPWQRLLQVAERGQSLAFGVSRTPAREAVLAYSDALFDNHVWMLVRRDRALDYRSLADLKGLSLCLQRGVSYGQAFEEARQAQWFRVEPSDGDLLARTRMLVAGRCDVMLSSHRSAKPWFVEQSLRKAAGLQASLAVLPTPMLVDPVHLVAARGHRLAEVLPRLNTALRGQRTAIQALIQSEL